MIELGDKGMFSPQMDFDVENTADVASMRWLLNAQRVGLLNEELRSGGCCKWDETVLNSMMPFRANNSGCSPGRLNVFALERGEGWSQ